MANITPNTINVANSALGTSLQDLLLTDDIQPGVDPSYQLCKTIYLYHPLGGKMAEAPVSLAQSQEREITVPDGPEEKVTKAFVDQWKADKASDIIFNVRTQSRVYGIASAALVSEGVDTATPVDYWKLYNQAISFNVLDPLNTSGSLVLNQNPNAADFQHVVNVRVSGQKYHPSRTCVMMNGSPVYIAYTTSAFGYVGRSCYQRVLYPLKSFIQTMVTDDMVAVKAGLLIAKIKPAGSIVDQIMQAVSGLKRAIVQAARTGNVISIAASDPPEEIETLNMQNIDKAMITARKNILENIAAGDDMPAQLLNSETFAEGFGEGTEDAKKVAQYAARERVKLEPLYVYFDKIVQHRAWNPDFYALMQQQFPERYRDVPYKVAFYQWRNSFVAKWPNLLEEPDSEKVKTEDVKLKALIAAVVALAPMLDPYNRSMLIQWCADNLNQSKLVFGDPLELDIDALQAYGEEMAQRQQEMHEAGIADTGDGKGVGGDGAQDAVVAWLRGHSDQAPDNATIRRLVEDAITGRLRQVRRIAA